MIKPLFNQRGSVDIIIITCAALLISISMGFIVVDNWYVSKVDRSITRVVDDLNRDLYTLLDVEYTAFQTGFQIKDDAAAYNQFLSGLRSRFHLDGAMNPLPDSPFEGTVVVEDFHVLDETEVPYSDGYGRSMEYPGIIALVQVPIKTPLLGITGVQRVLITTEIYR